MVKGIILDVDGVIVGDKPGLNFPSPNDDVIDALAKLHAKGMPIVLCTAKFGYAIIDIIKNANLNNPHVTDGGALVINPLEGEIIKEHVIDKELVLEIISECLKQDIYTEIYTPDEFFMQKNQVDDFTQKRIRILQKQPTVVETLSVVATRQDIIKILCFAREDHEVEILSELARKFGDRINFIWSTHPFLPRVQSGVITAPNVSKFNGLFEALVSLNLTFDEMLGVGDTASDWNFMKHCKYVATLENADEKIKELVKTKGEGNYLVAPSVDKNGIFEILKYFL
jgi:hydroxymethylpyrimidine pyrophosphatase-like HAD family hydrolase